MRAPEGLSGKFALGIGLLGGTFDPVHVGHITLAEQALKVLNLVRVDFLPAGNPWQKHPLTPALDRVRMLELAVALDIDGHLRAKLDLLQEFVGVDVQIEVAELEHIGAVGNDNALKLCGGKSDRIRRLFSFSGPINGKTFIRGKSGPRFSTTSTSP